MQGRLLGRCMLAAWQHARCGPVNKSSNSPRCFVSVAKPDFGAAGFSSKSLCWLQLPVVLQAQQQASKQAARQTKSFRNMPVFNASCLGQERACAGYSSAALVGNVNSSSTWHRRRTPAGASSFTRVSLASRHSASCDRSKVRITCNYLQTQKAHAAPISTTASSTSRLRVAVDVDEVLGRFVYALNQFVESQYNMRHSVSDYWIYEFAKIWKVEQERSNHIVHEFFKSDHFREGIPVIPGALESLTRLSETCDLVVVTSRQHIIQDQTLEWIDKHYPGIFQEVYFGNHWSLEGVSRKKSDICKAVGASVLVDDNPSYAIECASAGIHVLLYDWDHAYPWSKLVQGHQHPLIQVVSNWKEVEQQLDRLAPTLRAKVAQQDAVASAGAAGKLANLQ